jgi:hypothetical protein
MTSRRPGLPWCRHEASGIVIFNFYRLTGYTLGFRRSLKSLGYIYMAFNDQCQVSNETVFPGEMDR